MSQIHLYGYSYTALPAPEEWGETGQDASLNDSVLKSNGTGNTFTFSGRTAAAIMAHISTYGVHNGMPYRQTYFDGALTNIVFDGYLDLRKIDYDSQVQPLKLRIPVIAFEDPKTVLDEIAIMTQGVLKQNGWLTHSDFEDCPFIIKPKKSARERAIILEQFIFQCTQAGSQCVSNILSAISDVLGLSAAIGLVELVLAGTNTLLVVKGLVHQWNQIKSLFYAPIAYYKAISFKKLLTKAFLSKGYTVEFGELDQILSESFLIASQNENPGHPFPNMPFTGEMKSTNRDYGYIISEILDGLNTMVNRRTLNCYTKVNHCI